MKPTTKLDNPFADLFEQPKEENLLEETIYDEIELYYSDELIDMVESTNAF